MATGVVIGADTEYVIAAGTKNSWRYRKWSSGYAEAWYFSYTSTSGWTKGSGGLGAYYAYKTISLPTDFFSEAPAVFGNGRRGAGIDSVCCYNTTTSTFMCYMSGSASGVPSVGLSFYAVGKWA